MHSSRITLGTANFTKPYGILSDGTSIPGGEAQTIATSAIAHGIDSIDTAIGYGDLSLVLPKELLSKFKIITKFGVQDNQENILKSLEAPKPHGILIHDPYNVNSADKKTLKNFLLSLKENWGISKIGVSIYDQSDLDAFLSMDIVPNIIQIPLNPFNQTFNNLKFKDFVKQNRIDVYARSLFLQGVLLADDLPEQLESLRPFWEAFQKTTTSFPSPLHALLNWTLNFDWIKSWVIGVSSLEDFNEIIDTLSEYHFHKPFEFPPVEHPLIDPRKWN